MRKIKVFVGSPGDVPQERDIVSAVVGEISRTIAPMLSVQLETIRWETHAWPDVGDDAQEVINREIDDFDVFVGIMWKRFGTPTKRAESGTGEEFERAYSYFRKYGRPKIMFYFRRAPFYSTDILALRQFLKVIKFRKELEKYGVLFWDYEEPIDFERRFREHLTKQVMQFQVPPPPTATRPPKIFLSYKRQDIDRVEPVYEAFLAAGFSPWMDVRDILPGGRWVDEVEAAIKSADFFLTFVSTNTVDPLVHSETGFSVGREVVIAREKFGEPALGGPGPIRPSPRSRLIPVRLDRVQPPSDIAQFQWIDLFSPSDLQRLTNAIQQIWDTSQIPR